MATIQLSFSLRTSPNCKTVHLLGSWDGYRGQLPLSKDSSKSGAWKGTFRFQGTTLKQGQRYWYYYIMDGHHVSHDPAEPAVVEPTTGRKLNVLDVPGGAGAKSSSISSATRTAAAKRDSRRYSKEIPQGRGVSPSKIISPRPARPNATQAITSGRHRNDVDALSRRLASTHVSSSSSFSSESEYDNDSDSDSEIDSDVSSTLPSLSSGSRSPTSSISSHSSRGSPVSRCVCDKWGVTKRGDRVRFDCGGAKCGFNSDESDEEYWRAGASRRQGVVIRGGSGSSYSRRR